MSTHSIHHVTAVTAQIAHNAQFYTGVLGLRLVKKSVNQDDLSAYHLFYADAVGTPGTDITFFDWPNIGANSPGTAMIGRTTFRVDGSALDWWEDRLSEAGSNPLRELDESGRERILFTDPEGQRLELVDDTDLPINAVPWTSVVPEPYALRGILGVDLESARPESTRKILTEVLGYRESENHHIYETQGEKHYGRVRVPDPTSTRFGRVGAGGVHHVAFRINDVEELLELQGKIENLGLGTSGLVDRYYFQSLYFREPGGILFELATDGPGFASDEPVETLGERLALPPFLENRRAEIEAGLKPI